MRKEIIDFKIGVYCIKTLNGTIIYIGASSDLHSRFMEHKSLLKNNKHSNSFLQNISNKIGYENLIFCILKFSDNFNLFIDEQMFIKLYSPTCNVSYNCNKIKQKNVNELLKDVNYINNFKFELNKKYYNKDINLDVNIKTFYSKLNAYCDSNKYILLKGNSNGKRFFKINN